MGVGVIFFMAPGLGVLFALKSLRLEFSGGNCMNNHFIKIGAIVAFLTANFILFQNCEKKMEFSTSSSTLGGYTPGEGDGDGGDYTPGEGDGIPNPNDPNDPDNPGNDPQLPPCTVTYNEIQTPVRILFLIDKTGSNADNSFTPNSGDGTDVNKNWRKNIITNIRNSANSSLFSYNLTLFRGNELNSNDTNRYDGALTKSLINGFSNNATVINNAISAFVADEDKGRTPHKSALNKARELIAADMATASSDVKYSVILITDGHPEPNLATLPNCATNVADGAVYDGRCVNLDGSVTIARGLAESIKNLDPARVNVNTIYYYSPGQRSSNAVKILKGVTSGGGGQFVEAGTDNISIDFKNIIRVPANTCPN